MGRPITHANTAFLRPSTARVINVDPGVSGKHTGTSQLIETDWQRPHQKTASTCSVYRFNSYEHCCKPEAQEV